MASLVKNIALLGGGTIAAQVVSLMAIPVITRLYDPADFGAFSFLYALVAVAFPVSTLRFNSALLLPEDGETADALFWLSNIAVAAVALIIMPGVALTIAWAGTDVAVMGSLWFLVAGVLVHGWVHSAEFWLLRQKRVELMAGGSVAESVLDRGISIASGVLQQSSVTGLIMGRLFGGIAHLAVFRPALATSNWTLRNWPSWALLVRVAKRFRSFPVFTTWAYLFANGGREIPTLMIAAMFSTSVAGAYALGLRVLSFPTLLIGGALAKAFFRHAVDLSRDRDRLKDSTILLFRVSLYLMVPPSVVVIAFGPDLFALVFGREWADAGRYSQVLSLSFLATFVYGVLSIIFDIVDRQRERLLVDGAFLLTRVAGVVVGGGIWGIEGALWGLLAASVFVHGAASIYLMAQIGVTSSETGSELKWVALTLAPFWVAIGVATIVPIDLAAGLAVGAAVVVAQGVWFARREPRIATYAAEFAR